MHATFHGFRMGEIILVAAAAEVLLGCTIDRPEGFRVVQVSFLSDQSQSCKVGSTWLCPLQFPGAKPNSQRTRRSHPSLMRVHRPPGEFDHEPG